MGTSLYSLQPWITQYKKEVQGITPQSIVLRSEQQWRQTLEKQVKQL